MRFIILFGLLAAVIGDLTLNNGEYTRAFGHSFSGFTDAIRNSSRSLWGA